MRKLDILISFNDVEKEEKVFGCCQGQKKFTTIEQMQALTKSLKKNWASFTGNIYALHSLKISDNTANKLIGAGFSPVLVPFNPPLLNRATCFTFSNDSEYSLVLDTDMLFLKEPALKFEKDFYMGYGGSFPPKEKQAWQEMWDNYCRVFDLPLNYNDQAFKIYHQEGKEVYFPQRNNGCLLIKTDKKEQFLKNYLDIFEKLKTMNGVNHFKGQCAVSIAFNKEMSAGVLPRGVNFIGGQLPLDERVSLFHYVGADKGLTKEMREEYFQ